jgi:prolipoprotein diacylglyceryltransferase
MQGTEIGFIVGWLVLNGLLSIWSFVHLPRERWQMLAVIPLKKEQDESWHGLNLTYYGLFNAIAYTTATAMAFMLAASAGVPPRVVTLVLVVLISVCVPASRQVAFWVERRRHTLTVGGASFVGILLSPVLVWCAGKLSVAMGGVAVPVWPMLSAFSIAYAIGEGIGRLACISFGCCYGCRVAALPLPLQKWMRPFVFRFVGKTRKIAYASSLEGEPVVAVQAFTNVLYIITGTIGIVLFLYARYFTAFLVTLGVTQVWRLLSELVRADYRGGRHFSAYQKMSLGSLAYAACLPLVFPTGTYPAPDSTIGLDALWRPSMLLALQGLFVFAFLFTGRSAVTDSRITFRVVPDRIG